jgi:hypothetical protein
VQVHASALLYVHVQVAPVHSACQTLPALSSHVDVHVIGPLPAALPPPEHPFTVPAGRGMFGHTSLGTLLPGTGVVFVTTVDVPESSRQS